MVGSRAFVAGSSGSTGHTTPTAAVTDGIWKIAAEESEDAIFSLDHDGLVTNWTLGATRLLGYTAGELIGRNSAVLVADDVVDDHRARVARVLAGERIKCLNVVARHRNGMAVPTTFTMVPLDDGRGACVVVRDVTEREYAQETLAESEQRLRETQELSHVGLWLWDATSDNVQLSDELYRIHDLDPRAFDGTLRGYLDLAHPDDQPVLQADLHRAIAGDGVLELEHRIVRSDGSTRWVYARATVEHDERGQAVALRGICQDITDSKQGAASLQKQAALLELLSGMAVAANEATSLETALRTCVRALCEHADWQVGHAYVLDNEPLESAGVWRVGDVFRAHDSASHTRTDDTALIERVVREQGPVWITDLAAEPDLTRGDRDDGLTTAFAFPVFVNRDLVAVMTFFSVDRRCPDQQLMDSTAHGAIQLGHVVERTRAREALARQALHDGLTNLPNRSLFLDRLRRAVGLHDPEVSHVAVIFIDLDNFKLINDGLGHDVGDRLLTTIADRLLKAMRPGDTTARFGGDEFMILCDRLPSEDVAVDIADRLLQTIAEPIDLQQGIDTVVTASAGIAIAAGSEAHAEDLVRDADVAMYRAKEAGGARYQIFDAGLHQRAAQKLTVATELRRAVDNDEFRLVYQPQVRVDDGSLIGVEALIRWQHPQLGLRPPSEFIPIAEQTQLIVPIGGWVLGEACRQAAEWLELGADSDQLKMCVNVSALQLSRPGLLDTVASALASSGIKPSVLCMEITESVLMADADACLAAVAALKTLGVSIAVDDFGTGYSSLSYLSRFPIDTLKIDKSFVDPLGTGDHRAQSIVRAVVDLSHALGVLPMAEGVETLAQLEDLKALGCEAAQGFYFARPKPPAEITPMLQMSSAVA